MIREIFACLTVCGYMMCEINAMQNIVIQNKMSGDIFVESFTTSGTVVFNQIKLVGESLQKDNSATIKIGVVSPTYSSENNCVILSLFNKSVNDYAQVKIAWGGNGTKLFGTYVVNDFYRISQQCDAKGNVIFTLYDYDDISAIERLKADVLSRLKANASSQQKQSEDFIKTQSGLKSEEI